MNEYVKPTLWSHGMLGTKALLAWADLWATPGYALGRLLAAYK